MDPSRIYHWREPWSRYEAPNERQGYYFLLGGGGGGLKKLFYMIRESTDLLAKVPELCNLQKDTVR